MKKILLSLSVIALLLTTVTLWAGQDGLAPALHLYFSKDYPAAVESFKQAIAEDPNNAAAYYYLGYAFQEMGDYPAAREAFTKAYEINPDFLPDVPGRK